MRSKYRYFIRKMQVFYHHELKKNISQGICRFLSNVSGCSRERAAVKSLAQSRGPRSTESWQVPRDLLAGVVLHPAALRKRYMMHLGIRCRRLHSRRQRHASIPQDARRPASVVPRLVGLLRPVRRLRAPAEPASSAATQAMDALALEPVAYPDRSSALC